MSLNWLTTAAWAPSDWVDGMQPNGLSESTMWAQSLVRVVDVLGDLEVSLAAAGSRVVEGMAQALELELVGELVADAAERPRAGARTRA